MRRVLMAISLLFVSWYGYSQQYVPSRIIGSIPSIESTQTYQIQVGAFKNTQNANNVFRRLESNGFKPIYENHLDLTRVLIPNLSAGQVWNHLIIIKSLGFDEVIIREGERKKDLTDDIQNLIPPDILSKIEKLGIEINDGRNPPDINGTYFVNTLHLVSSTAGSIAHQRNKYVTFSGQDNSTLTINVDYTMEADYGRGPMNSQGPGSFIVGEGNKFTVVVDGTREQDGYTAKTVEIFSGEISDAGILNYHWAVMMINDSGDPLGIWIDNGTGYAKKDGDGFSERVERNTD